MPFLEARAMFINIVLFLEKKLESLTYRARYLGILGEKTGKASPKDARYLSDYIL